jgi:preprotein translocase subunit SecA
LLLYIISTGVFINGYTGKRLNNLNALKADYAADFPLQEWLEEGVDVDELESRVSQGLGQICDYKEEIVGSEQMRGRHCFVALHHQHWCFH